MYVLNMSRQCIIKFFAKTNIYLSKCYLPCNRYIGEMVIVTFDRGNKYVLKLPVFESTVKWSNKGI